MADSDRSPASFRFEQTGGDRPHHAGSTRQAERDQPRVGLQLWEAFARCENSRRFGRSSWQAPGGRSAPATSSVASERADEEESLRRRGSIKHYVAGPGRWTSTVRLMRSLPQPIVARIQGYAYGAGFNLALGADFRVMASDARLATPFIKRGLATAPTCCSSTSASAKRSK